MPIGPTKDGHSQNPYQYTLFARCKGLSMLSSASKSRLRSLPGISIVATRIAYRHFARGDQARDVKDCLGASASYKRGLDLLRYACQFRNLKDITGALIPFTNEPWRWARSTFMRSSFWTFPKKLSVKGERVSNA